LRRRWNELPSFTGGQKLANDSDRDGSLRDLIEVVDLLDRRLSAIEKAVLE